MRVRLTSSGSKDFILGAVEGSRRHSLIAEWNMVGASDGNAAEKDFVV